MVIKTASLVRLPAYRAWQFIHALGARSLGLDEWDEVAVVLSPAQQALFRQMANHDQQHGLEVMRALARQYAGNQDLLAAALLHDVGKALYPLRLWERSLVVLARVLRPSWFQRWSDERQDPWGWRRPFVLYQHHPKWGAEMAAAAGCAPLTGRLIGRHHDPLPPTSPMDDPEDMLLRDLQQADGAH